MVNADKNNSADGEYTEKSDDGISDHRNRQYRAAWVQTELLITFPSSVIVSSTLIPLEAEETAGRFRIWLTVNAQDEPVLVWDRKTEGGFPELKVVVSAWSQEEN